MTLSERVLAFAREELAAHVQEEPHGSNRGARVDEYNRTAGVVLGSPWCLAFAYWCVGHAAAHTGVVVPICRTGSCHVLFDWADVAGRLLGTPVPGCVGLVRGGPFGHEHAVVVEAVLPGGRLATVEGNTNADGAVEGYEVARHTFRRAADLDFVDAGA